MCWVPGTKTRARRSLGLAEIHQPHRACFTPSGLEAQAGLAAGRHKKKGDGGHDVVLMGAGRARGPTGGERAIRFIFVRLRATGESAITSKQLYRAGFRPRIMIW